MPNPNTDRTVVTRAAGAERYGFPNGRQFRAWCHRNDVPLIRRGRHSRVLVVLVRHVEDELINLRTGRPVFESAAVSRRRSPLQLAHGRSVAR